MELQVLSDAELDAVTGGLIIVKVNVNHSFNDDGNTTNSGNATVTNSKIFSTGGGGVTIS
nr:hypothetical protein [uncultured Rhodopila sp.]